MTGVGYGDEGAVAGFKQGGNAIGVDALRSLLKEIDLIRFWCGVFG